MIDKVKQGKKNRAAGKAFELKVRKDLEANGWTVDKWTNNVEFIKHTLAGFEDNGNNNLAIPRLVPCKAKFNPFTKALMMNSGGFPDFIAFRVIQEPFINVALNKAFNGGKRPHYYEVIGVECKINSYLDRDEKEKIKWLKENRIFSTIMVASKGSKRGEILYEVIK